MRSLPALALLLAVALALAGCAMRPADGTDGGGQGEEAPWNASLNGTAPEAASRAPQWSFEDTEGATHSSESSAGRPVVFFWMASWCSTCKSKTPLLRDVQKEFAPRGAQFYTVTFDPSDTSSDLEDWKARYDQPWPHGVDPGFSIGRAFGVTSQSSVVVLDGDGEVVSRYGYGKVTGEALRADLEQALAS